MRRAALVCLVLACEASPAPTGAPVPDVTATPTGAAATVTPTAATQPGAVPTPSERSASLAVAGVVAAPSVTPATAPVAAPAWSDAVPADAPEIQAWLQRFAYRGWAPQTPIRMTGEHGGERLYFNAALVASLAAGAQEHPVGSAAVRELYAGDLTTLKGFALMHKTGPSGPIGEGWYWYEIFGVDAAARPTVAEAGARGCVGCHSHAVDFVHSPDTPRDDPQPLL